MAPPQAGAAVASTKRPRSRKSIAHMPSPDTAITTNKENMTLDTSALAANANSKLQKRSRSRSLGPGGIEALQEDSGNRGKAVVAAPRSILKPAIPLSPLKEIPVRKTATHTRSPSHSPTRKSIPIKTQGRAVKEATQPLLGAHVISPKRASRISPTSSFGAGADPLDNEAVEQEKRRVEKEEAIKQRDARRKSMANRRVSFAPEATLHTWDMLEDMNDATSSTATSASARRASEISNGNDETHSGTMDDILVAASPAERQEAKERRKRRRSSGIPPMNFNNPDDAASSSPATGSSDVGDEDEEDELSPEKVVGQNLFTPEQEDAILRESNGTPDQDEDGDMSMEIANEEITVAFKPWAKQMLGPALDSRHLLLPPEQENINPFSPAFKGAAARATSMSPAQSNIGDGDMSMDITQAIGGIIAQKPVTQRQSVRNRRRSSASSAGGETMEFTMAVGGIKAQAAEPVDESHADTNEDLSMEFTAALGGILNANPQQHAAIVAEVADDDDDDNDDGGDMEMTTALGGFYQQQPALQDIEEETGNMDMEMTTAFGGISASQAAAPAGSDALPPHTKQQTSSPLRSAVPPIKRKSIVASETGSPTITTKSPRTRAQAAKTENVHSTPLKSPSTPSRRSTPRANRPTTPAKTPPSKSTSMQRESTPKKLFQEELSASKKTGFTPVGGKSLRFDATAENTMANAFGFMSPAKRRMSGLGLDKEGLGSPRVAALLDRRTSIGDQASPFTPSKAGARVIRFEDPKIMEAELIRDHQEQERRESGQYIMEQEAEGDEELDHTASLKEAIGNMTPKKTPQKKNLKGRKSLAPGGALGLLGKRPLELDESDNEGTPEGYRGREGSPVKKIRLQAPPTKTETLGRIAKPDTARASTPLVETASNATGAMTPKHTGHFKDAESLLSAQKPLPTMGQESVTEEDLAKEEEEVVEKIHLQDFLNLTSIRFMELNTTKRRHTIMPTADAANGQDEVEADPAKQFEDAIVAQACTMPMLELFQHSCRECKKYIAEGRGVIREIEADTFEENPLLFREYMSASPADRTVMDNQFKQMKTNARLISKGQWYAWRMQLLDGLKENLNSTAAEFSDDDATLTKHEQSVQSVLPALLEEHAKLEEDCAVLQKQAGEFDSSQQGELDEARDRLVQVSSDISDKKALVEKYKLEKQAAEDAIAQAQQERLDCQQAIQEAQRVREELRGWSVAEVHALKAKVDALETQHGWRITSASDNTLTMTYRNDLQLFFTPSSFAATSTAPTSTASTNAPISLTYIGDSATLHRRPVALPTHSRFFLQFLRAHLQCLPQSRTSPRALLNFVSTGWDKACSLDREVRALSFAARTVARIRSDEVMDVTAVVVLKGVSTKVEVGFEVSAAVVGEDAGMEMVVKVRPRARVVYGEMYKEDRMTEFVRGKVDIVIKARAGKSEGAQQWTDAVRDLRRKLVAQGRKG